MLRPGGKNLIHKVQQNMSNHVEVYSHKVFTGTSGGRTAVS